MKVIGLCGGSGSGKGAVDLDAIGLSPVNAILDNVAMGVAILPLVDTELCDGGTRFVKQGYECRRIGGGGMAYGHGNPRFSCHLTVYCILLRVYHRSRGVSRAAAQKFLRLAYCQNFHSVIQYGYNESHTDAKGLFS